jgi:hypothetical protein
LEELSDGQDGRSVIAITDSSDDQTFPDFFSKDRERWRLQRLRAKKLVHLFCPKHKEAGFIVVLEMCIG